MLTAALGFAVMLLGFFLGVPLGVVLFAVGFFGFAFLHPAGIVAATAMAGQQILGLTLDFQFSVLPLFILTGSFLNHANLSDDLYEVAHRWLGHLRGGLALATIMACAGFASVCHSSIATAATMARVAVPSMRRYVRIRRGPQCRRLTRHRRSLGALRSAGAAVFLAGRML